MTRSGGTAACATPAGPRLSELEQLERWRDVYDAIYATPPGEADPTFNTVGWRSKCDRRPIPAADMRAWLDDVVERLLCEGPRHLLEIGCGTGLILFRVAPHCDSYCATDISRVALGCTRAALQRANCSGAARIRLLESPADRLPDLGLRFDTIVLNSVIQHFPSVEYLDRVLSGVFERLAPGGRVYIGDVRDLALLHVLHAGIERRRAPPDLSADELTARVRRAIDLERELVLAREYFFRLRRRFPVIRHVEVQLKRGDFADELALFRYEVILHCGDRPTIADSQRLPWGPQCSEARLREILRRDSPALLHLTGIPNRRLALHIERSAQGCALESSPDSGPARDAREDPVAAAGADPVALVRLGHSVGYRTELHAACDGGVLKFDAVWRAPPHIGGAPRALPALESAVGAAMPPPSCPAGGRLTDLTARATAPTP